MIDNSKIEIDGTTYIVIDTIRSEQVKYVYLSNLEDEKDFFVRKEIQKEDGKNYLIGLSDPEEVKKAMQLFQEKNQ